MNNEIPLFSVIKRGSDNFPRFVIAKCDAFRNPIYWNSETRQWDQDESKATVFADVTQACWEQHDLLMEAVGERPVHRFFAPVYIELYGEKPKLSLHLHSENRPLTSSARCCSSPECWPSCGCSWARSAAWFRESTCG